MITSIFPTICADNVGATRDFYVDLLGFRPVFDSGWYVQLAAPSEEKWQLSVVDRTHESVPRAFRQHPAGVLIAIEVADVDAIHTLAAGQGLPFPLELRDEPWGQRHFMTVDPAGTLIDIITPIKPSAEFAALYQT